MSEKPHMSFQRATMLVFILLLFLLFGVGTLLYFVLIPILRWELTG